FPDNPAWHTRFRLWSPEAAVCLTGDLEVHLVELPKFTRGAEELTDTLEAWVYFLCHGAELDTDALPSVLRTGAFRDAVEELCMVSQNDLERERYEARLKVYHDAVSLVRLGELERSEGLAGGELIGKIHLAQRFLQRPETPRAELLALSREELER